MENTIKLQGIYGRRAAKPVKDLRVGDVITWNFGYQSEVIKIEISKTGKSATLTLRSLFDGEIRKREMRMSTLVVS